MHPAKKKCLNCNHIVEEDYCGKCGQSIHTGRINIKHITEELQYGLLHVNKGLFYTFKELLLNPGITIKNYLEGKRVKYTKPFIFLIICGVIYSFIFHLFHFFPMEEMNKQDNIILDYIPLYEWYSTHYSLVGLILIPFYALTTYSLFRNNQYNYIEHLVVFSYLNGIRIGIILLFYPLIYLTKSIHIYHAVQFIAEIYLIWGLFQFFNTDSWYKTLGKIVAGIIITLSALIICVVLLFLILRYYHFKL